MPLKNFEVSEDSDCLSTPQGGINSASFQNSGNFEEHKVVRRTSSETASATGVFFWFVFLHSKEHKDEQKNEQTNQIPTREN